MKLVSESRLNSFKKGADYERAECQVVSGSEENRHEENREMNTRTVLVLAHDKLLDFC